MNEDLVEAIVYTTPIILTLWVTWKALKKKPISKSLNILKWLALVFLTFVNIFFLVMSASSINMYLKNYPKEANTLLSLTLGMSYEDVLFKKGKPKIDISDKKEHNDKELGLLAYYDEDGKLDLVVGINKDRKVDLIVNECVTYIPRLTRLHGVMCGTKAPIERLASYETMEETSKDGLTRRYCYPELRTCYWAQKERVTSYAIYLNPFYPWMAGF